MQTCKRPEEVKSHLSSKDYVSKTVHYEFRFNPKYLELATSFEVKNISGLCALFINT